MGIKFTLLESLVVWTKNLKNAKRISQMGIPKMNKQRAKNRKEWKKKRHMTNQRTHSKKTKQKKL